MKPTLREKIRLSPDYPEDWIVFEVIGSLQGMEKTIFFRDLQFTAAKYGVIFLDMSRLMTLSPSALDDFIRFNQQLNISNRKLVLTGLPDQIFDHHVRLIDGLGDLRFFKTVEEALETLKSELAA